MVNLCKSGDWCILTEVVVIGVVEKKNCMRRKTHTQVSFVF